VTAIHDFSSQVSEETRKMLDQVWDNYVKNGTWPKARIITSRFHGLDEVKRLLAPLDGNYIVENDPEEAPVFELRLFGVLSTAEAPRYVHLLEEYLKFLRHLTKDAPEVEEVRHDEVAAWLNLSPNDTVMLGRVLPFLSARGLFRANHSSGPSFTTWNFRVPKRSDEIPDGPLDDFLRQILSEYWDQDARIWISERRAHSAAISPLYPDNEFEPETVTTDPFNRWYSVFVSSTFRDLQVERERVAQALLQSQGIPAGMELFPAASRPPWEVIAPEIDAADYYVLIIAGKYGTLLPDRDISFTESEFDYACEKGKSVLAFCHEDIGLLPPDKREESEIFRDRLIAFREKVQARVTVKHWNSPETLQTAVILALTKAIRSDRKPGWVRASDIPLSPGAPMAAATPLSSGRLGYQADALAHLDLKSRTGAEHLLELLWGAKQQRLANGAIPDLFGIDAAKAPIYRDRLFEASLANRMVNMESPGNDWVILTDIGRAYVLRHQIHLRIPLIDKFGLPWNERKEPYCRRCVVALPIHDERSLRCDACGKDYTPHDGGTPLTVKQVLDRYGGQLQHQRCADRHHRHRHRTQPYRLRCQRLPALLDLRPGLGQHHACYADRRDCRQQQGL